MTRNTLIKVNNTLDYTHCYLSPTIATLTSNKTIIMTSFKKILVPTDFSVCSKNALKNAVTLAKETKSELFILHVYYESVINSEVGIGTIIPNMTDEFEQSARKGYKKLEKEIPSLGDVKHTFLTKQGITSESIISTCYANDIDLIIMGTQGVSGFEEVIIGSNTYDVIKKAHCPVLAIPQGSNIYDIKKIAFAGDYKKIEDISKALKPLMQIAHLYNAEIHIIHIDDEDVLGAEEFQEAKKLERYLKNTIHSYHFDINKNIIEGIDNYVSENEIDLLVLIPHKRNLFEKVYRKNITKKLVFHTKTPLMTLNT